MLRCVETDGSTDSGTSGLMTFIILPYTATGGAMLVAQALP